MEHNLCILLYSKYSEICLELLKAIEDCPVNICEGNSMILLCVDNKDIRKKIIECKNIEIKTLPTLLLIYNDDVIIKHEEQKVFDWIDNYVNKQIASKNEEKLQIQIDELKNKMLETQYIHQNQIQELLYNLEMNKLEIKNLEENKKLEEIKNLEKEKEKTTYITEQLMDDAKEFNENINNRPLAGVRSGPNNYEMSDFGNQEQPERNTKKNSEIIDNNKASLMQTALSMQKEREVIDVKSS